MHDEFFSEHWEFVPRYGQETKAEFLKITLSHMRKDSWPDQGLVDSKTLRLV
jgi:hypothetical protein